MTTEQKLLNDAAEEIKRLRRSNELMNVRLDMFDKVFALVQLQPQREGGMMTSSDIVRDIDSHLRKSMDQLTSAVRDVTNGQKPRPSYDSQEATDEAPNGKMV